MTLESTVICLDTSDYLRNGDFTPNRMAAQIDASMMLCQSKMNGNPENNIGLLTMKPNVIMTLTTDINIIISQLDMLKISEEKQKFDIALRTAHLVLKHRTSTKHKMRIIAFVASPIECTNKELRDLAKKFRKEKVDVDVVNFGEEELNKSKLEIFIDAINGKSGTGSNLVNVSRGSVLIDQIKNSAMLNDSSIMSSSNFEFGVDPSIDPELALALKMSMQDHQTDTVQSGGTSDLNAITNSTSNDHQAGNTESVLLNPESLDIESMSDEQQLIYALQLSLKDSQKSIDSMEIDTISTPQTSTV
ncbi:26S proteasome regulatory subunit RPN10 [Intoshia linei]|uniref:26S proteasome non-ATPase regulatory subunit 4 n=1 Tax=Intoshia linei TaxID=1819745 RepID=A0A177B2H1_9BILA|nr:26S proteasome regulatory subunit RPN10 [Intoshia linei]